MTGATPSGFGTGESLGLASALFNSLYIISVNVIVPRESAHRMTLGTFIGAGVTCAIISPLVPHGVHAIASLNQLLALPAVSINLALLVVLTTVGAYGLLTFFQPLVDPTRAALIYLIEPIFASLYAYVARGHALGRLAILGGALIVLANAIVEWLEARARRRAEPVGPV
jgi:drug/metabolite transporter (DMT)-like permease